MPLSSRQKHSFQWLTPPQSLGEKTVLRFWEHRRCYGIVKKSSGSGHSHRGRLVAHLSGFAMVAAGNVAAGRPRYFFFVWILPTILVTILRGETRSISITTRFFQPGMTRRLPCFMPS